MRRIDLKIGLIALFILCFSYITFAESAIGKTIGLGSVSVSNVTMYTPYPAEPGRYVDIWVRVENLVDIEAENVTCAVDPAFPFSLDPNQGAETEIGNLAPYREVLLRYRLRIDENAVQGNNKLAFKCKTAGYSWSSVDLQIYIQTHDAVISVEKIETSPAKFQPGETGTVSIDLKNLADSLLKDISIKLDVTSDTIPFAPVNSIIEKRIKQMSAGEEKTITFSIKALQDAKSNVYKVPVNITYKDDLGKDYSESSITSLIVERKPVLFVVLEKTEIMRNGTTGEVTFGLVNKGLSEIKFLTVKLGGSDDYTILSADEIYVGNMLSDDSDSVDFKLFVNTERSLIDLPLQVDYQDETGNKYSAKETITIPLYTQQQLITMQILPVGGIDPILLVIIVIVVVYILYRIVKWIGRKRKHRS